MSPAGASRSTSIRLTRSEMLLPRIASCNRAKRSARRSSSSDKAMQLSYSSAAGECAEGERAGAGNYAWLVFALTFGLLLSDYMSRQVLNAVFPLLKAEWALTDARLGLLSGIVALMVGLLTFPLSLLADRFGRVQSLAIMATVWSLATLA